MRRMWAPSVLLSASVAQWVLLADVIALQRAGTLGPKSWHCAVTNPFATAPQQAAGATALHAARVC